MSLDALPRDLVATRDALHQIGFFALSPARYKAVGRMGLRSTHRGFGTPEYEGRVGRVEGSLLVHEQDGNIATQVITTVRAAAEFFGNEYTEKWFEDFHDPLTPTDPDVALGVDEESSLAIGRWFEYGFDILNQLRAQGSPDDDVSEVQLWPEHFDPATELGSRDLGQRASFGASPGDGAHPVPYLYVAAWGEIDRSEDYWNNTSFNGASLGYADLAASADPIGMGLEFLIEGYRILRGD